MRHVGILGGAFDPIHEGHLTMARQARDLLGLDEVLILPMAHPAHRKTVASFEDRMTMCRLAAENEEKISVSDAGAGSHIAYTADILPVLEKRYPDTRFSFIIGTDKLSGLPHWKDADKLFSACDFVCFPRIGVSFHESLEKARKAGARVQISEEFIPPYRSTEIRDLTAQYEDAPGLPMPVLCFMAENGVYQKDFLPKLKTMMNPHRFGHTLGVRREAVRLAALHHAPVQKAALAGLLHDCAKGMPKQQMTQLAKENHLTDDPDMLSSSAMLHGPVGAYVAQKQFHVLDEDVLSAIRSHTIGRPGMTKLELVIFVADATEAGREEYEGLQEIRRLADISLAAAALKSLQCTEEYLRKSGRPFFAVAWETVKDLEKRLACE